jgi:hypothetical protein
VNTPTPTTTSGLPAARSAVPRPPGQHSSIPVGSHGTSGDTAPGSDTSSTDEPTGPWQTMTSSVRAGLAGTPGRLRILGTAAAVATLVFGLAAGQAFRAADGALERVGANSEQLVRIQAIQTDVVQADADATNAFLVGGLEPPAQRADYVSAITSAAGLVAEAAQHQPADGQALGALNQALLIYSAEIEQARANNRQALPIGAQYLKEASANLRADALPLLKNLVDANNQRVEEEFDNAGTASLWLVIAGLLTMLVLVLGLVWLARRTRRYVNLPLAAAALVVLVTLILGAVGLARLDSRVEATRDGAYGATLSMAQARIAAFDAKSNESLALIARGSGAAFEKAWQASDRAVQSELGELAQNSASSGLAPLPWTPYVDVHEEIRILDDGGDWESAVQLAIGTGSGTSNAAFSSFDDGSSNQLATLSDQTATELDQAGNWLPLAGALGLLAGVLAAISAWWGVSLRLEEYR